MQAAEASNRPISLQPFGQVPCRAVCGVAALVDSRAIHCAPRLASPPGKAFARPRTGRNHALCKRPQADTLREVQVQLGNNARKQIAADLTGALDQDLSLIHI